MYICGVALFMRLPVHLSPPETIKLTTLKATIVQRQLVLMKTVLRNMGETPTQAAYWRLCGAQIGKGSIVADNVGLPELLQIGKNCFLASDNILGKFVMDQGSLSIASRIQIGDGCFLGNLNEIHENLPEGCHVGLNTLVTVPPNGRCGLFGNPPLIFPAANDMSKQASNLRTTHAQRLSRLLFQHGLINCLYPGLKMLQEALKIQLGHAIYPSYHLDMRLFGAILGEIGICLAVQWGMWFLMSVVLFRSLYNNHLPLRSPYNSMTVNRWAVAIPLRQSFPIPVNPVGTPFHQYFLRAQGVKLGHRFFSAEKEPFVDPAFAVLGDDVTIDYDARFRQHDFVGGMLQWGSNQIGNNTTLMQGSVLAMADIGDDAVLMPTAVTWKGMLLQGTLESGVTYAGAPAEADNTGMGITSALWEHGFL